MAEQYIFNVDQFKTALVGGGYRPNQFAVVMTFPSYVTVGAAATLQSAFLIQTAALPESEMGVATVQYRGRAVHFAGDRVFNPWNITVLNDSTFVMRNAFEQWMNGMGGLTTSNGKTNPGEYQTDMQIVALDRNNFPLKSYTLQGAFPFAVSDVPLAMGDNDTISSFTVGIRYQNFVSNFDTALSVVNAVNGIFRR